MDDGAHIEIEYCTQCRWLLRAAWMAQELLVTFEDELGGVTLVPGTGGVSRCGLVLRCSGHGRPRDASRSSGS